MNQKRVFVITGTSKGIGLGLAQHFANDNLVAGCSRGEAGFEHPNYKHYSVDVTDEKSVQLWARQIKKDFGRVDVLVANVGLVKSSMQVALTSGALFEEFIKMNLVSTFLVGREFSKIMLAQKSGRIVNISSIMTDLHENGTGAYTATKGAVEHLSKVMARELITHNVTVNTVSPSMVITDSNRKLGEDWEKWMLDKQSIKRAVKVEELANVIEFFAAPLSGVITGQVVRTCMI